MMKTVVVKATRSGALQDKINQALEELVNFNIVDIKLAGSFDGQNDNYVAVIMYTI
ncbi:hypothetical protein [Bacillus thuringiensis]|uniref:hypothetical protein n=1 Tax=Bacillus thuringiensis TaxID=1428 RepID=UPI0018F87564|nr:hypothetical protein [Bacillus thuringiensis]